MAEKKASPQAEGMFARILETRTIILSAAIDAKTACEVTQQLVLLNHHSPKQQITLLVNSPGGDIFSGLAIYDMLRFVSAPIISIVSGLAASMGSIIPLAADKGRRYALPNAKFLIHQPLITGYQGRASELEIQAQEIMRDRERIITLYAQHTGRPHQQIAGDIDRDHWMQAPQAKTYGLIDRIITSEAELKKLTKKSTTA